MQTTEILAIRKTIKAEIMMHLVNIIVERDSQVVIHRSRERLYNQNKYLIWLMILDLSLGTLRILNFFIVIGHLML